MADQIEFKLSATEFKATGDSGQYEGHFSIFNNLDDGGDVMHPGAFLKTISENRQRVKVFYAHDWMKLIGPTPDVLEEDATGLFAKGRLTLDSFWGKETWALMKDGALNEGSIGYSAVKYDYEEGDQFIRHLREVKLYEISPVPLGMNALTSLRAMKAALLEAKPDKADPILFYIEKLNAITTELKALKEGRVLSASNKEKVINAIGAMKSAMDALGELLAAAEPQKDSNRLHSALLKRLRAVELALAF